MSASVPTDGELLSRAYDQALKATDLIEQMADVLSVCSEMLNGRDSMIDALAGGEGVSTKSPLTKKVDEAMEAWRHWKFA